MNRTHFVAYVTGGLRSGKGLFAIKTIQEFAFRDCRIVTNYDLYLENLLPHSKKSIDILRIPDRPNVHDLEFIGEGYTSDDPLHYDESKFGLIVLDELGAWMNCRAWNEKGRKEVIDWLLHSGKRRWSLLLTIQDLELLDSQFRNATASQLIVRCFRLGDIPIPFVSPIIKLLTGYRFTLPDMRLATTRVGDTGIVSDRSLYKGKEYYRAYNTRQEFYVREHENCPGIYSYLSPWHLKGRYIIKKDWAYLKALLSANVHWLFYLLFFSFSVAAAALGTAVHAVRLSGAPVVSRVVREVSKPIPKPVPVVDCMAFNAMFAGYTINGHAYNSATRAINYFFVNPSKPPLKSLSLALQGYQSTPKSDCSLVIVKSGCFVELTCDVPALSSVVSAPSVLPVSSPVVPMQ